jgi:hypothetical protein
MELMAGTARPERWHQRGRGGPEEKKKQHT